MDIHYIEGGVKNRPQPPLKVWGYSDVGADLVKNLLAKLNAFPGFKYRLFPTESSGRNVFLTKEDLQTFLTSEKDFLASFYSNCEDYYKSLNDAKYVFTLSVVYENANGTKVVKTLENLSDPKTYENAVA